MNYRAGIKINITDLEKMLSGPLLVTGRTLLEIAKKGLTVYMKVLSFAVKKMVCEKEPAY